MTVYVRNFLILISLIVIAILTYFQFFINGPTCRGCNSNAPSDTLSSSWGKSGLEDSLYLKAKFPTQICDRKLPFQLELENRSNENLKLWVYLKLDSITTFNGIIEDSLYPLIEGDTISADNFFQANPVFHFPSDAISECGGNNLDIEIATIACREDSSNFLCDSTVLNLLTGINKDSPKEDLNSQGYRIQTVSMPSLPIFVTDGTVTWTEEGFVTTFFNAQVLLDEENSDLLPDGKLNLSLTSSTDGSGDSEVEIHIITKVKFPNDNSFEWAGLPLHYLDGYDKKSIIANTPFPSTREHTITEQLPGYWPKGNYDFDISGGPGQEECDLPLENQNYPGLSSSILSEAYSLETGITLPGNKIRYQVVMRKPEGDDYGAKVSFIYGSRGREEQYDHFSDLEEAIDSGKVLFSADNYSFTLNIDVETSPLWIFVKIYEQGNPDNVLNFGVFHRN